MIRCRPSRNSLFTACLAACLFCGCFTRERSTEKVRDSIVRVTTRSGSGTGFFVRGPDGHSYVATAFHLIENGGPITVSRYVRVGESDHYVEAYPETRIVTYDREADLAILQTRNVPDKKLPPLALAEPVHDEPVRSFGFPASSLVGSLGLTVKEGRLSNIVQLPVIDRRARRVVKQHAIKGLIVSSALEPGFSGGPTVNGRGQVVGLNVQKDEAYQAQNGAVHSAVLRALIERIQPPAPPSVAEVTGFLEELQAQYLQLPIAERPNTFESDFLSLSELPALRKLAENLWWSRDSVAVQLALSIMPGRTLETTNSTEVREQINTCKKEHSAQPQTANGFKPLDPAQLCGDLTLRPLAWDMLASTLRWDGRPRRYVVASVTEVDPLERHYLAKVSSADESGAVLNLHLVVEGSRLKLRVFDDEVPHALKAGSRWVATDFAGRWYVQRHSVELTEPSSASFRASESLLISVATDGATRITHDMRSEMIAAPGNVLACNQQRALHVDLRQEFEGSYANGAIRSGNAGYADVRARRTCSAACDWCGFYSRDKFAFFKRIGDRLIMYRSDGEHIQEQVFTRGTDG